MLIRPLQGQSELNPVIVTIGLLVVLEGLAGTIYGNASRGFPAAFSQSGLTVGSTKIAFSHFDVFILVAVLALMTATLVLFRATTLGLRMRASAFAREISRLLGVRVGSSSRSGGPWPAWPGRWPASWWRRRARSAPISWTWSWSTPSPRR